MSTEVKEKFRSRTQSGDRPLQVVGETGDEDPV